ncbi:MAG: dephospho-CoA kinase [Acidobacteriaceae bacterium]|nr:dephospho-CoA kinase [Acidobacteriaceae bacterium]
MLRVGLTGGVSCGKSTVARMMEERGAFLIQADHIAHDLMKPGQPVYNEVVKRFGREIVNVNYGGTIDRNKLADAAFGGGRIAELNQIVHPAVIQRQEEWMAEIGRKVPEGIAVVEAALIVEAGVKNRFDKLVVVTCPEDEKVRRFVSRSAAGEQSRRLDADSAEREIRRRMTAQLPDSEKVRLADFVVDNSGFREHTEAQVEKVMEELRTLAAVT